MEINCAKKFIQRDGPCYHAGVDTIDGFCYSWHKKLTPEELDRVYDDFLVKEGIPDPVQQDEKDLQAIDRV